MEKAEVINKLRRNFELARTHHKRFSALYDKVLDGTITYPEVQELAKMSGEEIGNAVYQYVKENPGEFTEEELMDLIPDVLQINHEYVSEACEVAQEQINKKAGVGLKPAKPDFDRVRASDLAKVILTESEEAARAKSANNSMHEVDEAIQKNAELHDNVGLNVTITRRYDGVGLRDRTKACSWCLARQGTWGYRDALDNGVFERHVGCGCTIIYKTSRFTHMQTRAGGWNDITNR